MDVYIDERKSGFGGEGSRSVERLSGLAPTSTGESVDYLAFQIKEYLGWLPIGANPIS